MFFESEYRDNIITPLFVGSQNCENDHRFGPAVREYYILHYIVSGHGEYTVNNKKYTVSEGQAFLIKPGEVTLYRADEKEPWSYIWVAWKSPLEAFSRLPPILESRELKSVMHRYPTVESIDKLNICHTAALIWSVAACLAEPKYEKPGNTDYTSRALSLIEQHYTGNLSVNKIAETLCIDRSYFSNLFKKEVGISPRRYITELRMQKALELLEKNRYSVSVVAASVGFSDQFTFSRCFKSFYGVSPTDYKKLPQMKNRTDTAE